MKNGPGQLNLSGSVANTYTGGTVVNGSTLALGSLTMNSSGLGTGAVTFENGGRISMFYNTSDYNQKPNWNMTVADGQSGTLVASGRCIIGGSLSGGGIFYFNVPYVRADWSTNCANFTGTLSVTTDADGGTFRVTANTNGLPLCTVNLANMVDMGAYATTGASGTNASTVVKVGALSGVAGSSLSGGTWQIGNNNKDALFAGTIGSGASVTKIGTGNWVLSGANATTNPFYISGGKLTATNTTGSATGTSTVYVNNTGTLAGTGTISGAVVVNSGGTLSPGNNGIGTITLGATLAMQTGSKLSIGVVGTQYDKVAVTSTVVLKGTLEMINSSAYKSGDTYSIISGGSITGQFDAISPATPGDGLKWDTSRISEGIISVGLTDGIEDIFGTTVKVYPNPVKENCTVTVGALSGALKVEITDQVGRVISSEMTDASVENYRLSTSRMTAGFYYIRITTADNKSYVRKVVKL